MNGAGILLTLMKEITGSRPKPLTGLRLFHAVNSAPAPIYNGCYPKVAITSFPFSWRSSKTEPEFNKINNDLSIV